MLLIDRNFCFCLEYPDFNTNYPDIVYKFPEYIVEYTVNNYIDTVLNDNIPLFIDNSPVNYIDNHDINIKYPVIEHNNPDILFIFGNSE